MSKDEALRRILWELPIENITQKIERGEFSLEEVLRVMPEYYDQMPPDAMPAIKDAPVPSMEERTAEYQDWMRRNAKHQTGLLRDLLKVSEDILKELKRRK